MEEGPGAMGLGRMQRGSRRSRIPLLAGWLFADLCLVIFVVSLASVPSSPAAAKAHARHSTVNPHPARPPQPQVLERTPADFYIGIAPDDFGSGEANEQADGELLNELNQELATLHMQGRKAGFVLIFASGPSDGISQAIDSADAVIRLIRSQDSAVFGEVTGEGLWNGQGSNNFHFQIFFYA